MSRTKIVFLLAAALAAACTPTVVPPPAVTPQGDDRYLLDPRTGATDVMAPPLATRFEAAWRNALGGNETEAERLLVEIRQKHGEIVPAMLLDALIDIRAARYDDARRVIERVKQRHPENLVARVYEAEIAVREGSVRIAHDLYRDIAALPDAPPTANERLRQLEEALFNELYAAAQSAPDAEAIRLLREALAFNAGAIEPRILLARKLVALRQFEEARTELDPLLNVAADRAEVQEILAEIDVGRGRYQDAIVRLDRLARRTRDPRYERRLEEIKQEWSAANMPAHVREAWESPAITRSDLAVLLYWAVPNIRFAQNLGSPPIAVDVEDLAGREEVIRALAIGLFDVDPVTRRVSPYRIVPASRFSHHLARVLMLRGAECARGIPTDRVLATCGVSDPLSTFAPEDPVAGRDAQRYLEEIAKKL